MDITYLLALQELREQLPDFVEKAMVLLSYVGDGPALVAIMLVVYWCINKKAGQFSLFACGAGTFACHLMKNVACVYRPWVRDAAIVPAADALKGAGGYSFPSGHTTGTAASLGSFAWLFRKKHKWVTLICAVVVLLMMFSRNYLGVHAPQDVLAGLLIALVMIALTNLFFRWIDRCDELSPGHNKDIVVMVVALVLCAASLVVVTVKPYPMDYVDGQLLVDPVAMQKGSFEAAGVFAGLAIAWTLERRFVGFSTDGLNARSRIVRFLVGAAITGISFAAAYVFFKAIMPYNWAKLFTLFIVAFMAVFVAPLTFNKIERRMSAASGEAGRSSLHIRLAIHRKTLSE